MVLHNDKRDFHRMTMDFTVRFRPPDSDEYYLGRCKNLSTGGIAFICDQYIDTGAMVEIDITPDKALVRPLQATMQVLRSNKSGQAFEIAGKFTEIR